MSIVNQFLSTVPFDLYELSLFHLVVKHRNFTKAAQVAGLTQSAVTRQIQGMENSLGVELLERTTRSVRLTKAGEFLFHNSLKVLGDIDLSLRRIQEDFANAPKEIRIAVSRSVALAHLPGFFHGNLRQASNVAYQVAYQSSSEIVSALELNELDLGVLCPPQRLPGTLHISHRFTDAFALIAPASYSSQFAALPKSKMARNAWLARQVWLLINDSTNTGKQLQKWMLRHGLKVKPAMQLDSFDLVITLVSLGMGISFVPIRALALYGRKKSLVRLPFQERFERQLVVVMRKQRKMPQHLDEFIKNILF